MPKNKMNALSSIKKNLKIKLYSEISPKTVEYMQSNKLVMRNTNSKQLISRHYGYNNHFKSHGIGVDYCVPLWTVAHSEHKKKTDTSDQEIKTIGTTFLKKTNKNQIQQLLAFINNIKKFITPYVSFEESSNNNFDYELIIAQGDNLALNDLNRYSTGGRAITPIHKKSILFRSTLNAIEINYLKALVKGTKDSAFSSLSHFLETKSPELKFSVRKFIANKLAAEIICAKLIYWLNQKGNPNYFFSLDTFDLDLLLHRQVLTHRTELNEILTKGYLMYGNTENYLSAGKYESATLLNDYRLKATADVDISDENKLFFLLERLKLNPNNKEHLSFWASKVSVGGITYKETAVPHTIKNLFEMVEDKINSNADYLTLEDELTTLLENPSNSWSSFFHLSSQFRSPLLQTLRETKGKDVFLTEDYVSPKIN